MHRHPLAKKLAVHASFEVTAPTLFVDADVMFFPAARGLPMLVDEHSPRYLADCAAALDARMLRPGESSGPVNSGAYILAESIDWSQALERYAQVARSPSFHSEQTAVHLAIHAAAGAELPRRSYLMSLSDQFRFRGVANGQSLALRHFVGPIRHRFWLEATS
jgi:hypothetical protein